MSSGIGDRRLVAKDHNGHAYEVRRAEIVAAAGALFRKHGYQGTTLAAIAEAVGTERASLYYYVASKEDLFDSLVSEPVLRNLELVERIRDADLPAPEKLRSLIVELLRSFDEHYPFLYVYLQQNLAHVAPKRQNWAAHMRQVNRRFEDAVTEIIEQGVREGIFHPVGEPWVTAYGVIGMISWTHRWFNPASTRVESREIAETYAQILLAGLSSPSGAKGPKDGE